MADSRAPSDRTSGDRGESFVTVARSLEPMQIEMLRARLEAEGIQTLVLDAGVVGANLLYSIAVGGVRLLVPRESAQAARLLIDLVQSGQLALREGEEPAQE
jgi:hypothetical protein